MKKYSYSRLIRMSWDRTAAILFRPFKFKKWIMLGVIVMLAGQMGGLNFNFSGNKSDFAKIASQFAKKMPPPAATTETAPADVTVPKDLSMQSIRSLPVFSDPKKSGLLILIVGGVLFLLGSVLFMLMWVKANFAFVFIESVVKDDASFRVPFHRNKPQGNSYLMWNILFSVVVILTLCAITVPPLVNILKSGMLSGKTAFDIAKIFAIISPYIPVFIMSIFVLVLVSLIVVDFILPIMYRKKTCIVKAWSVFGGLLQKNLSDIVLYFLVKLGLAVLTILISVVLVILGVILFLLAGGIAWLLGWLVYLITPQAVKATMIVVLIVAGVCILVSLVILFSLVFLPIPVFFRLFSMYVLGSMDESLDVFAPNVSEMAQAEDDEQYKKSMALVWLAVLSPVIILVLALLTAIAIPNFLNARQKAQPSAEKTDRDKSVPKNKRVTVHLKNGNSFKASIERESGNNISFAIDGGSFTLPRSDVLRIEQ
ncbi:MAG: hypothetical protein PHI59_07370 [Candidatus Omnitrophica bacterium]|nr:hypothetical protein [Candidatus Omnitrophota bacterium]